MWGEKGFGSVRAGRKERQSLVRLERVERGPSAGNCIGRPGVLG